MQICCGPSCEWARDHVGLHARENRLCYSEIVDVLRSVPAGESRFMCSREVVPHP